MTIHLALSWSISRGRDTYGYNIARLDDTTTGKRYRTCGGGYDMTGTVFGEWLQDRYQAELRNIAHCAGNYYSKAGGYQTIRSADGRSPYGAWLYGMTRNDDTGAVTLDGACGLSTMIDIAAAIGLDVMRIGDKRGRTTGFIVSARAQEAA